VSWDINLFKVSSSISSLKEIVEIYNKGENFESLGTKTEVIEQLKQILPKVDFSDPTWGKLEGNNYFIEFNMGDDEIVDGLMLHIRGGDEAIDIIKTITIKTGWKAFDCSDGNLIDFYHYPNGFQKWQNFREQATKKLKIESPLKGITIGPDKDE